MCGMGQPEIKPFRQKKCIRYTKSRNQISPRDINSMDNCLACPAGFIEFLHTKQYWLMTY